MHKGKVVLVGAGPGDAGLLTVKGRQMLSVARVVVYDRLVCDDILEYAPNAKKVYVGKQQGFHPVPQHEINDILLQEAKQGGLVVRLKGGDPYVFGRGAEEAEYLAQHGVLCEVVPGVTSAISALGYAGIPATYRGLSSSLHIITGHARAGEELDVDFEALCRTKGTLVFLMAVASMPVIVTGLLHAGMPAETPAAVVQNGTLPTQQSITGTLATIVALAQAAKIQSPAIFAVGQVCAATHQLGWFEKLPLFGKTVVVTRPMERAGTLGEKLRSLGANVLPLPCIKTQRLNIPEWGTVLERLAAFKWLVLTSPQGATYLFEALETQGLDARALATVKIAAIGASTAEELQQHGIKADYIPEQYDAVHLANGLLAQIPKGGKVLLLRAQKGTPELLEILKKNDVAFEDVAIYQTEAVFENAKKLAVAFEEKKVDYVTFTSASTVEGFFAALPGIKPDCFTAVCIGDSSQAAAKAMGCKTIKAQNATIECLVQAILEEEKHA